MGYQFKVLQIADVPEWQPNPDDLCGGAGPSIDGAWLARRITVEVANTDSGGNVLSVLETKAFLIAEPYSTAKLSDAVNAYKATLPSRNDDEGLVL